MPTADAIWKDMQDRGVEFVFAQFVDMYARPSAKLVPVGSREAFDGLLEDGAGFAGFAAGEIGQGPHEPDLAAMPDVRTFTPLPWRPGVARIACDIHVEGQEWPYCPRTILRRQLKRARSMGFEFMVGAEPSRLIAAEDGLRGYAIEEERDDLRSVAARDARELIGVGRRRAIA